MRARVRVCACVRVCVRRVGQGMCCAEGVCPFRRAGMYVSPRSGGPYYGAQRHHN